MVYFLNEGLHVSLGFKSLSSWEKALAMLESAGITNNLFKLAAVNRKGMGWHALTVTFTL